MNVVEELEDRLARYDADRYPVQRATALFHLGAFLTGEDTPRARDLLVESIGLFERSGLTVEEAKARNALGAALRDLGDPSTAADEFRRAAEALEPDGNDRAAALFNLALVTRDAAPLEQAEAIFARQGARREEAATARELGALHLEQGDVATAVLTLERAVELADAAADDAAVGGALNALGLAYLAAGRHGEALDVLGRAAAAHPRGVRPQEHAMAKANLALAYEAAGNSARARLAAKQALGIATAPTPVTTQARETLDRLGAESAGDLVAVLKVEPEERWPGLVREELVRWAEADDVILGAEAAAWTEAQDFQRAEALVGALFELPPDAMERVLAAILAPGTERTRKELERAASLFHAPQELRLRDTIARLEERRNSPVT